MVVLQVGLVPEPMHVSGWIPKQRLMWSAFIVMLNIPSYALTSACQGCVAFHDNRSLLVSAFDRNATDVHCPLAGQFVQVRIQCLSHRETLGHPLQCSEIRDRFAQ